MTRVTHDYDTGLINRKFCHQVLDLESGIIKIAIMVMIMLIKKKIYVSMLVLHLEGSDLWGSPGSPSKIFIVYNSVKCVVFT